MRAHVTVTIRGPGSSCQALMSKARFMTWALGWRNGGAS
jgi:hypothetical protein